MKLQLLSEYNKQENYLYKNNNKDEDENKDLYIPLELDNIKEGKFFNIDNEPIIFLDRIRRCFNIYIKKENPINEYFSENKVLLDKLDNLSDNFKGTLHNNLVHEFNYIYNYNCSLFTTFLDNLVKLVSIRNNEKEVYIYINIKKQFYKNNTFLIHIDLDLENEK